jgi:2'-5' RNA ligase
MSKRNEHVVAIMLEPVKIGQEFIDWPLHITVVPWFPCDDDKKLDRILSQVAKSQQGFAAQVSGIEMFGSQKNVKVNLVEDNPQLTKLHWRVFNDLEKNDFGVHQKEFVGDGYRAHITHQKHANKQTGDKLEIKSMTLVKQVRLKKTGTMVKTIAKTYKLG